MRKPLVALVVLLLSGSAIGQQSDPAGWGALVSAIDAANPFSPATLLNKQFAISVPGAKPQDSLEMTPADVFSVERQAGNVFLVTIVRPDLLVQEGSIKKFKDVGFSLTQSGIKPFSAAIEGKAVCAYQLTFRQKGGGADFNLASLEPEYDIAFEESGPGQLATRTRTDSGLSVQRLPGDQGKVDVRMVLKPKAKGTSLVSNWVSVPSCAAPTVPAPSGQVSITQTAGSCMQKKTIEMTSCTDNCGTLTLHLKQRFENVCTAQRVRCEGLQWRSTAAGKTYGASQAHWVQLNGGEFADFDVALPAPLGQFTIGEPNLDAQCKFN